MKTLQILLLLSFVLITACSKKTSPVASSPLEGTWKLIEITNGGLPYLTQPPGNILLTFSANGTYYGHTLANTFWDGTYNLQDSGRIWFEYPTSTSVVEDEEWSRSLFTIFASCLLQSSHPCKPCIYTINGNRLFIDSPLGNDLVFEKK